MTWDWYDVFGIFLAVALLVAIVIVHIARWLESREWEPEEDDPWAPEDPWEDF